MPRSLRERWAQTQAAYRRRHRQWTMEVLPSMPEDQWKEYTAWVASFGNGSQGRKLKRRLEEARAVPVTATVTNAGEIGAKLHEAMNTMTKPTARLVIQFGDEQAVATLHRDEPRKNNIRMLPRRRATRR